MPTHYSRRPIDFVAAHWSLSEVASDPRNDTSGNNLHLTNSSIPTTAGDIYARKILSTAFSGTQLTHGNVAKLQSGGMYFAVAFLWTTSASASTDTYVIFHKGKATVSPTAFEYWASTGGATGFAFNVGDGTSTTVQAYSAFTLTNSTPYFCFCQINNNTLEIWQRCGPITGAALPAATPGNRNLSGLSHVDTNDLILADDASIGGFSGSIEDFYIIQNYLFTDAEVDAMFFRAKAGRPLLGGF